MSWRLPAQPHARQQRNVRPASLGHGHSQSNGPAPPAYLRASTNHDRSISSPQFEPLSHTPSAQLPPLSVPNHHRSHAFSPLPTQLSPSWGDPSPMPLQSPQSPQSPPVHATPVAAFDRRRRVFDFQHVATAGPVGQFLVQSDQQQQPSIFTHASHTRARSLAQPNGHNHHPEPLYSNHVPRVNGNSHLYSQSDPDDRRYLNSEKSERRRQKQKSGERQSRALTGGWFWLCWRCGRASDALPLPLGGVGPNRRKCDSCSIRTLFNFAVVLSLILFSLLGVLFVVSQRPETETDSAPTTLSALVFSEPFLPLPSWLPSIEHDPREPLPLPPQSLTQRSAPPSLLMFSIMRDFSAEFSHSHSDEYHRYNMALTSWLAILDTLPSESLALGEAQLVIFVDHSNVSCPLIQSHTKAAKVAVSCLPVTCVHNVYTRPLMNCLWQTVSADFPSFDYYAFVNGDILLFADFLDTLALAHYTFEFPSIVAKRRDASFVPLTSASFDASHVSATHAAFSRGLVHDGFGIDVFVLPRPRFRSLAEQFPSFLVGIYRWDNWLLARMLQESRVVQMDSTRSHGPVLDATQSMVVGHSDIVSDHLGTRAKEWNDELCKKLIGPLYRVGNIDNADFRLVPQSDGASNGLKLGVSLTELLPQWSLLINTVPRLNLLLIRHATQTSQALAFLPVKAKHLERDRPDHPSLLAKWLCQSSALAFTQQVVVTDSAAVYWTLLSHRVSSVVFLRANEILAGASRRGMSAGLVSMMKESLELSHHALFVDVTATLLDHPLMAINHTCDVISLAPVSPHYVLLPATTRSDHSWNLVRKVDECLALDEDERENEISELHDCMRDVTVSAFMPLTSFIACVEPRAVQWKRQHQSFLDQSIFTEASKPWPAVLVNEDAQLNALWPVKQEIETALCHSCSASSLRHKLIQPSSVNATYNPRIILHVHVRRDTSEREVRLFLRSLLFADYDESRTTLVVVFDIHALPHSNPPKPTELATRFESILDEFEHEIPSFIKFMPTYSHLSAQHALYDTFVQFAHQGEEYRAVWGTLNDWHLFLDTGLLLSVQWHRWARTALDRFYNQRTFAINIAQRPATSPATSRVWRGASVPAHRGVLGMLMTGHAATLFASYNSAAALSQCVDSGTLVELLLMDLGLHVLHTSSLDLSALNAFAQSSTVGELPLLSVHLDAVQNWRALHRQLVWWRSISGEKCAFQKAIDAPPSTAVSG